MITRSIQNTVADDYVLSVLGARDVVGLACGDLQDLLLTAEQEGGDQLWCRKAFLSTQTQATVHAIAPTAISTKVRSS